MSTSSQGISDNTNVQVVVRLRPPDYEDEDIHQLWAFPPEKPNQISLADPLSRGRSEHLFQFSKILKPETTQEQVYDVIARPLIDHLLNGFNSCCFAYGQTGSGKTYSIFGEGSDEIRGMLPRATEYLFERIGEKQEYKEIGMVVSFLEVYLDRVRDLGRAFVDHQQATGSGEAVKEEAHSEPGVAGGIRTGGRQRPMSAHAGSCRSRPASATGPRRPQSAGYKHPEKSATEDSPDAEGPGEFAHQDLQIHETEKGQVFVKDLTLIPVKSIQEVMAVINMGSAMRQTHETGLNANSSRSHTVFTINVVQKDRRTPDAEVCSGVVHLVDLAGSERLARSKSEGKRFQEAVLINSSLSALGQVVLALANDVRSMNHIPYRNSKLTRILQNSLGGNAFTTLLTTINPSADNYEESLNALQFADRCKNVNNKPTVNYIDPEKSNSDRRIKRLMAEITDLKQQLTVAKSAQKVRQNYIQENLGQDAAPDILKSADAKGKEEAEKKKKEELNKVTQMAAAQLQAQAAKTQEAKQKNKAVKAMYASAKKAFEEREKERRFQLIGLEESNKELHKELQQEKHVVEVQMREQAKMFRSQTQAMLENTKKIVEPVVQVIRSIPPVMLDTQAVVKHQAEIFKDRQEQQDLHHSMSQKVLRQNLTQHVDTVKSQYFQWLGEKEEDLNKVIEEYKRYTREKKIEVKEYQQELVQMFMLCQRLTRIVEDMEMGVYPYGYQSGVRSVNLPAGVKPNKPHKAQFQRMFRCFKESMHKSEVYETISSFEKQAKSDEKDTSGIQPPDSTSPMAICGKKVNLEHSTINQEFDADEYASSFCSVGYQHNGGMLAKLNVDQLRKLCAQLKHNITIESGSEDTNKFKDQALAELKSDQTFAYIADLEEQLRKFRSQYNDATTYANRLKTALESSKRMISRPPSAHSRSSVLSRPTSSRPQSATHARASTGGMPDRPMSGSSRQSLLPDGRPNKRATVQTVRPASAFPAESGGYGMSRPSSAARPSSATAEPQDKFAPANSSWR